jgi:hypothetical protein
MEKLPEVLACCLPIPWLVGAADDDVQASPTPLPKIVAPPSEERVQLLELDAHGQLRSLEGVRGQRADVFMESFEVHDASRENSVDERPCAAQQLGGSFRWDGYRWCEGRAIRCGLCVPNLCALFVKLARGELGEVAASICHERQLDAEREVSERLELVILDWYDLLALFPAVAEERRIVADQDNHGDAVAELRQDLLDKPRVSFVEADVNGGKRPVTRREVPCFGEFALCVWVRELHGGLTSRDGHTHFADFYKSNDIPLLRDLT